MEEMIFPHTHTHTHLLSTMRERRRTKVKGEDTDAQQGRAVACQSADDRDKLNPEAAEFIPTGARETQLMQDV